MMSNPIFLIGTAIAAGTALALGAIAQIRKANDDYIHSANGVLMIFGKCKITPLLKVIRGGRLTHFWMSMKRSRIKQQERPMNKLDIINCWQNYKSLFLML
ncbi:exported hypothetical protein [Treponema phagedenis]|uniref:Uncharacterized protein n=1 Tax=Treponema phagedenis TaxID=162 RepID=A0A0B7GPS2_TREPH|nr:exported hypothetical protein [Treponema phagedenis]